MIKAHPTNYRGYLFRSRLEARWAAFFDRLGVEWRYEPFELDGYIPDFILPATNLLVEVKPILKASEGEQHVQKIAASGWKGECIIVGAHWNLGRDYEAFIAGIYIDTCFDERMPESDPDEIDETYFGNMGWAEFDRSGNLGWTDVQGGWSNRLQNAPADRKWCGNVDSDRLERAWAAAHKSTQWRAGPR